MEYICRKCGNPVKNKEQYDVFENMHWLCFHLEFEHGAFDYDEPCDDPDCPWNRISGNDIDIINTYSDAKLRSESSKSVLFFNVEEIESNYLPSRVLKLDYHDENYKVQRSCWFEDEKIHDLINSIDSLVNGKQVECKIGAMSPNEFELNIRKLNSRGYYLIELEISTTMFNVEYESKISYQVTYDVLLSELIRFKDSLQNKIMKKPLHITSVSQT